MSYNSQKVTVKLRSQNPTPEQPQEPKSEPCARPGTYSLVASSTRPIPEDHPFQDDPRQRATRKDIKLRRVAGK